MEHIDALAAAGRTVRSELDVPRRSVPADGSALLFTQPDADPQITFVISAPARPDRLSDRCFDVVVASLLLVLMLPLMAAVALTVFFTSRGPVLFKHKRIGRDGLEFQCLKFRTMTCDADAAFQRIMENDKRAQEEWLSVQKLQNDPRVTFAGRFLRRYCLDELPQLFNVIAGDMSVVGPRPIVISEISRYGSAFLDYCSVRPGLTGLWQVSGRHRLPYEERVRLDSEYARTKSLLGDIVLLWRTVPVVLLGINQ